MQSTIKHDIAFLDFLRGWSALLVFCHHASILGGGPSLLAGNIGHEAVNAFMMASGFLIYFQCSISKIYNGLQNSTGISNFYIRRFFRIAPVYYFCLIIALLLSEYLGHTREAIAIIIPESMTDMNRYYITEPIKSFLIHTSFIFGLLPSYSFSTPLPDWSLGLEMQFYLIFPILFLLYKKSFVIFFPISILSMFFVWWTSTKLGLHFPMPSYLPLKFHNFAAGMALAYLLLNKENKSKSYYFIIFISILSLAIGNGSLYILLLFIFSWWWICTDYSSQNFNFIKNIFAHRSSKYLAEISYSVYIFHLIIMPPFFAFMLKNGKLSVMTWIVCSAVLLLLTMAVSNVIYKYIEIPGINAGKKVIEKKAERDSR